MLSDSLKPLSFFFSNGLISSSHAPLVGQNSYDSFPGSASELAARQNMMNLHLSEAGLDGRQVYLEVEVYLHSVRLQVS